MIDAELKAMRAVIDRVERSGPDAARLFAHEDAYFRAPQGISVVVPVHDGARDIDMLLLSLQCQHLNRERFEVIFALNGCTDASGAMVRDFARRSGVATTILEEEVAGVARARNAALQEVRFRHATFVDHDDHLSRQYLQECLRLADYRSVVVSNIVRLQDGRLIQDHAQTVIDEGFRTAHVHPQQDIALCYRAYTLNAIKTAPAYMLRAICYDESLAHSEDVAYWRDLVHAFQPVTVKSPTRRDLYHRKVVPGSLSRRVSDPLVKDAPRRRILDRIAADAAHLPCDGPQRSFDLQLEQLLRDSLIQPDP